jgi:hypothetical protein
VIIKCSKDEASINFKRNFLTMPFFHGFVNSYNMTKLEKKTKISKPGVFNKYGSSICMMTAVIKFLS